jgi:glycosyltransferase involved in cell wall biosynthesis
MNIGIKASKGKYVIRIDAHSDYAKDYISKCVYYLENIDADNVGGPMVAKGKDNLQKIIAASYHSKFALGGGKFHDENYEGYADTVYLGAYKKDALVNIGMYDEKFTRNQDDELNYRLIKNGGKIFITPNIKSLYFPRNNYRKLLKQYFEYGFWKVEVIKKHGVPARITHLVPACFVVFLIFGIAASLLFKPAAFVFLTIIALYLVMNLYFSFTSKHIKGLRNKLRLMLVHFILHSSYGIGFIRGLLHFLKAADWLRSLKLWKIVNKRFTRKKESE